MLRLVLVSVLAVLLMTPAVGARDGFRSGTLKAAAPRFIATEDRDPSELCQVGVQGCNWYISEWLTPPEEYAIYCDPADCDECGAGWQPLAVSIVLFTNQDNIPCDVRVRAGIREADMSTPGCPVPGDEMCASTTYQYAFMAGGLWEVYLPLNNGCDLVTGPFFATVAFEAYMSDPLPYLVTADGYEQCVSYDNWSGDWVDLVAAAGFPGPVTMFATLECQGTQVAGALDIKPGSCPNPFNITSQGVLPVAILGDEAFDVSEIDPSSIIFAGSVSPLRWSYEDVSTPVGDDADPCECTTDGADGFMDMTLKFDRQDVVEAIMPVEDGDVVSIEITGELTDGSLFAFEDCVWIIDNTKGPLRTELAGPSIGGPVSRGANEPATWGSIKALYR
ncbi:MAG: hypothetical protein JXB46_02285 [Candidatus Eisenbacteria bacterium]|nr:hypothetical protein [Candidatus Eisenbacteria bacterium]